MSRLDGYKRVVIKIGSALLVDRNKGLRVDWLASVAEDIAHLRQRGSEVLVVSSGAIALGRTVLGLPQRGLRLEESQAAAAAGQIELARAYAEMFSRHGFTAGQILLTLGDTEVRRRYLNARETITMLLKCGAVPIINENDTVATSEIRYGDNDRLAARVASMASADLLVLLSDVDGLYTAPPDQGKDSVHVERVAEITPQIEAMAGDAGTELSRGGMVTKIEAAKIATQAGTSMVIASGKTDHPLARLDGGARSTWFESAVTPMKARKKWINGQIDFAGKLFIDPGAIRALRAGKSLLPPGVRRVEGAFGRGDIVEICDEQGVTLGVGQVAYDAGDAAKIAGRKSGEILEILGYAGRAAVIHRDDMSLRPAKDRMESENA